MLPARWLAEPAEAAGPVRARAGWPAVTGAAAASRSAALKTPG